MNFSRVSDAMAAPLKVLPSHGADRRAVPWWSIFTVQFWLAPLVPSWSGISETRAIVGGCVFRLVFIAHPVTIPESIVWGLAFVASMAKSIHELNSGIGSVFGRREVDPVRAAAVDASASADFAASKAGEVVQKIDAVKGPIDEDRK